MLQISRCKIFVAIGNKQFRPEKKEAVDRHIVVTFSHLLLLTVTCCHLLLLLIVTCCHMLLLLVTCCHLLLLLIVTCCHLLLLVVATYCYLLSHVVTCCYFLLSVVICLSGFVVVSINCLPPTSGVVQAARCVRADGVLPPWGCSCAWRRNLYIQNRRSTDRVCVFFLGFACLGCTYRRNHHQ